MKLHFRSVLATVALAAIPALAHSSYADHAEAKSFIADMQRKHGLDVAEVQALLGRAERNERVIELIQPPTRRGERSWHNYRSRFLTEARIFSGIEFWDAHADTIAAASKRYGVAPEFIVAIIGIETNYGSYTGNFQTVSALATLAFDYPPRAELFRRELENLLLLAREQGRDPFSYHGSYAGAMGYAQFLPSSMRHYAVDFDGNGSIDFDSNPVDAIGSVANYFAMHGWRTGEPVATRVGLPPEMDPAPLIAAGIEPTLDPLTLQRDGLFTLSGALHADTVTLIDLPTPGVDTEYWLGYRNFYVITRYNRSSFYAMSVFELAEALSNHMQAQRTAAR